jgi:hypothetical protein
MKSEEEVRAIKRRHSARLLQEPGVSGVGVERDDKTGQYVLALHLDSDDPALRKRLPAEIEGCPVKFIHSGPFRKLSE